MLTRLIITIGILLLANQSQALSTDKSQDLVVIAESAVVDKNKGSTVYSGDVSISQGSMLIAADKVEIITSSDGVVIQIIAQSIQESDQQAHLEQQPDNKEPVYAEARKISYFIQEERIHLSGNATLRQSENEYTGELVDYDINQGIVNLDSGPDSDDRIRIKYKTSD